MTESGAGVGASGHQRPPRRLWPTGAAILGLVGLGALLLGFLNVVQRQASDGERRQAAMSAWSQAAARCNSMSGRAERDACRAALAPVPRDNASLKRVDPAPR